MLFCLFVQPPQELSLPPKVGFKHIDIYLVHVFSFHIFIQTSVDLDPRPWVHFKQIYLLPFPVLLSGSQPPREVCASKPPPRINFFKSLYFPHVQPSPISGSQPSWVVCASLQKWDSAEKQAQLKN